MHNFTIFEDYLEGLLQFDVFLFLVEVFLFEFLHLFGQKFVLFLELGVGFNLVL